MSFLISIEKKNGKKQGRQNDLVNDKKILKNQDKAISILIIYRSFYFLAFFRNSPFNSFSKSMSTLLKIAEREKKGREKVESREEI